MSLRFFSCLQPIEPYDGKMQWTLKGEKGDQGPRGEKVGLHVNLSSTYHSESMICNKSLIICTKKIGRMCSRGVG